MGQGSFFETNQRRYALVLASYSLAAAIIVGLFPLITTVDFQGKLFAFGLSVLFGAFALWRFVQARKLSATEPVYLLPHVAPREAQRKYFLRARWTSAFAFPTLTAITAWDLCQLESGEVERVSLWGPLSLIYEHAGIGPTIAAVPVLGMVCMSLFLYKLKQLEGPSPPS